MLLAAQVVNFLVLLWILKRLLYKPLLKVLEERKERIAQSLKDAEEIERQLKQTGEDRDKALEKVSLEARKIVAEATKSADLIIQQAHTKTQKDIDEMLKKGQDSIKLEREKMHQELREELAEIVVSALEKVTGKILTRPEQKKMVEDSVKRL